MIAPYRLVATDLDGTLLRSDHTISARTRAALATAQAAGAAHLVVTGRSVAGTRHILDDLGYTGLAVCGQGSQLYHAGQHRLLTSVTLNRAVARRAVTRLEAALGPLGVAVNRDGREGLVVMDEPYRDQATPAWFAHEEPAPAAPAAPAAPTVTADSVIAIAPDRGHLWSDPIIKLYLSHPDPAMTDDALAATARALVGDEVQIVIAGKHLVEMLPLGLTKATGLRLAARRLGVTAAGTIAFGDMPNDVPMLTWSAHGVAMANAHAELIAVADEVTSSNDDDGIAKVLEPLLAG